MRFSIQSLLIFMLVVALSISALIQIQLAASARARASDLRSQLDFYQGARVSSRDFLVEWTRAQQYETDLLAEHERLIDVVSGHLEQAAAKIKIEPVDGQLSVLELPRSKDVHSFPRSWQIHIPKTASFDLVVDFVDESGNAQNAPEEFDDQSSAVIPLDAGTNLLDAEFTSANKENSGSLIIKLNEEIVIQRVQKPYDYAGMSYLRLDYIMQRDFKAGTNRVMLLRFGSTPGKAKVRARIVRRQP